ncbi:MAG: heat-inducible transcriptional repressor HrcA [Bacilli bacterium]
MNFTRQDEILKLIVEDFIASGEPVGSNSLIKKHDLPYSSATVRNDMMKLESMGYIEKTHTSSGRVPSSKGYRYYVEYLKNKKNLSVSDEFKREFQLILQKKSQSIEDIMNESCEILSELTNSATVVLGPDAASENLVSISMIPISPNASTAIFVTDRGYVEHKTIVVKTESQLKKVKDCVDFLNKRLTGTKVSQLVEKLEALKPILSDVLGNSSNIVMDSFIEACVKFAHDRMMSHGAVKLLNNPEYKNKERLQAALDLIQSPEKLKETIKSGEIEGFSQNEEEDVAILSHDMKINGLSGGKIAIVGPQRMDYKTIIGALEYVAKELAKYYDVDNDESEEEDDD